MAPGSRNTFGAPCSNMRSFGSKKVLVTLLGLFVDPIMIRRLGNCAPSCPPHYTSGSQIVSIRPYSLNTTTTFYIATECSDVTVFI